MSEPEQGMIGRDGSKESCATNKSVVGCIGQLIQLANTPFEKEAVIEFATIEKKFNEFTATVKAELKAIKYLLGIGIPILMVILGKVIIG